MLAAPRLENQSMNLRTRCRQAFQKSQSDNRNSCLKVLNTNVGDSVNHAVR